MNRTIETLESEVRSYSRSFPKVFARAEGSELFDRQGRAYLDFFAGAGALNYGHNNRHLQAPLLNYIEAGGVTHSLDMATEAKCNFLERFAALVLGPRDLDYKTMFPGPTGTNSVEAALKLARKVTGRAKVASFTRGFHGMTLGSLATTGNAGKRHGAGLALGGVDRMPFDGYLGEDVDTLDYVERLLDDPSSGVDAPAAFIVETVQGEGGVNLASPAWLRRLADLAHRHAALLIIDDVQVGCGRTGPFFSFETLGVEPDIVCLSKSLSGYGLPFALTLFRPQLDVWKPGEHNGTFRGNNLAFVTATAALDRYWRDDALTRAVDRKAELVRQRLGAIAERFDAEVRGRGLIWGLDFGSRAAVAGLASREAFGRGLLIETSGAHDEVLKLLPPLTITEAELERGLDIIGEVVASAIARGDGRTSKRKPDRERRRVEQPKPELAVQP
ncbi:Diaminobutyrate--2-oxoglutarate transaminase [Enhygromyxa salina]|uniref:Diaminobutyrate--2-oxoglutarate transaminase n=1 Tax=Enhygromyxa salina TaxID=215803 RepID=A0A2S9YD16_9BACT|nr:diaminobutyrate--2-oxoglutarate transaminase [Enhygromyxa salina]PRQ03004.1 Diaminobutyrate--2-oxoglutarate transaminase [Enhygromyxa salina]